MQVMQRPRDMELDLQSTISKDKTKLVASLSLQNITSKSVQYDEGKNITLIGVGESRISSSLRLS